MSRFEFYAGLVGAAASAAALTAFAVVMVRAYRAELRGDPIPDR